jgi:hypothetical protein
MYGAPFRPDRHTENNGLNADLAKHAEHSALIDSAGAAKRRARRPAQQAVPVNRHSRASVLQTSGFLFYRQNLSANAVTLPSRIPGNHEEHEVTKRPRRRIRHGGHSDTEARRLDSAGRPAGQADVHGRIGSIHEPIDHPAGSCIVPLGHAAASRRPPNAFRARQPRCRSDPCVPQYQGVVSAARACEGEARILQRVRMGLRFRGEALWADLLRADVFPRPDHRDVTPPVLFSTAAARCRKAPR